jgi:hypothetical protein
MRTSKGRGFGKERGILRHKVEKRIRLIGTWSRKPLTLF